MYGSVVFLILMIVKYVVDTNESAGYSIEIMECVDI